MDVGTKVRLRGKTLKGKNRMRRGGAEWKIVANSETTVLVESTANPKELFWMEKINDQHVEKVEQV